MVKRTKAQIIADDMEARIEEGEFKRDVRLPTCRELVEQYHTSSRTIHDTIEALKSRGLIITTPGKGTFLK